MPGLVGASHDWGMCVDWRFVERPRDRGRYAVYQAATEADFRGVDDLWREVYGRECGWLTPGTGALHEDRYHPRSTYLIAVAGGEVAGTMRLVTDSVDGLPVEQFVSIDKLRGARQLIECQRLMVLSKHRGQRWPEMPFGVLAALVKGCLHWCLRNGTTHIVADLFLSTATTPIGPLLAIGFTETGLEFVDIELDEPDRSIALLLEVGELFSRCFRCDSDFYHYLMDYDEVIDVYG